MDVAATPKVAMNFFIDHRLSSQAILVDPYFVVFASENHGVSPEWNPFRSHFSTFPGIVATATNKMTAA